MQMFLPPQTAEIDHLGQYYENNIEDYYYNYGFDIIIL